jgi:signal peptidase I
VALPARAATVLPWLLPPLHRAARGGDVDALRSLLASGADVDGRDAVGSTALMHAAERQRVSAVAALLAASADAVAVNAWAWDAALYASTGPQADALLALLAQSGVAAESAATVPREMLGGAHGRLLRAPRAATSASVFGLRGLASSAAQSAADMSARPQAVEPGGVAIAGASCERLGLYAGQRYAVRALFWRPAAPFSPDERRIAAASLADAPPPGDAWELCAELASPRWMPWGSTEVSVTASRLRSVDAELRGALAVAFAGAAALLLVLPASTTVTFAYVPSDSMAPTLLAGDAVVAALRPKQIAIGDVLLFDPPPALAAIIAAAHAPPLRPGDLFIKRVVGVGGDTLSATKGVLTRNGEPGLPAPGCAGLPRCRPASYDWAPLTLAPGQLAVMGDNRAASTDSHAWGALQSERVVAKVFYRWWPLSRAGPVR